MKATVTSKGQVTLPKPIRDALGIDAGTILDFELDTKGGLAVRKVKNDPLSIVGMFHKPGRKPATLEDMDQAITEAVLERHRRAR